MKVFENRV